MTVINDHESIVKLANDLQTFTTAVREPQASTIELSRFVRTRFRKEFLAGGLDAIDDLIGAVNAELKMRGASDGLCNGAAIEHAADGSPELLHLMMCDFATETAFSHETIDL